MAKVQSNRRNPPPPPIAMASFLLVGMLASITSCPTQMFALAQASTDAIPSLERNIDEREQQPALRATIVNKGADEHDGTDAEARRLQQKKGGKMRRTGNTRKTRNAGYAQPKKVGGGGVTRTQKQPHHRGANKRLKQQRYQQQQQKQQQAAERHNNENEMGDHNLGLAGTLVHGYFPLIDSKICVQGNKYPDETFELTTTITGCCRLYFNGSAMDCVIHSMEYANHQHDQVGTWWGHDIDIQPPEIHYGWQYGATGSKSGKGGKSFKSGKADNSFSGWSVPPPLWSAPPPLWSAPPPLHQIPPVEQPPPIEPVPTYMPTCESNCATTLRLLYYLFALIELHLRLKFCSTFQCYRLTRFSNLRAYKCHKYSNCHPDDGY